MVTLGMVCGSEFLASETFLLRVRFEFIAELADVARDGHRKGIGQDANGLSRHFLADVQKELDVRLLGLAMQHAF
jgi:hypothetical protein